MQILVLGMHRSGTSIVARLLNMMGAYFAPEGASTGANQENPKGFWERRDVRVLNDMVLHSVGADWDRLSNFSLTQVPEATRVRFDHDARKIILELDAHRPWFLKEPRICVLPELWLNLLEFPVSIIVHRSAIEVARSLEMRNGFPLRFGLALWERYNTSALNATLGLRRIQVNHSELMAEPVQLVRTLSLQLEEFGVRGLKSPSDEEILAFVDPSLYRAKEGVMDMPRLSLAQTKLQTAFHNGKALLLTEPIPFSAAAQENLTQGGEWIEAQTKIADLKSLLADRAKLKETLDRNDRALAKARYELEQIKKVRGDERKIYDEKLRSKTAIVHRWEGQIAELREAFNKSRREGDERLEQIGGLRSSLKAEAANAARRDAQIGGLRSSLKAEAANAARRDAQIARLNNELRTHIASARRRDEQVGRLEAELGFFTVKYRILKKGFEHIEKAFNRLRASRSFHFMAYTMRRLGLVSRTPRIYVETIKKQLANTKKALRKVDQTRVSAQPGRTATPSEAINAAPRQARKPPQPPARLGTALLKADVIVCVRNALDDVRNCLSSLVLHSSSRLHQLILVNDGSDEPTSAYLRRFGGGESPLRTLLLESLQATGYTQAANRGLTATEADYAILLNSDTIVTPGWIERLIECGETDPAIGIVGPLSNAASWQSVPRRFSETGDWAVNDLDTASLARIACAYSTSHEPQYPRVPIVNGFCFAIKRKVIDAIGLFDENSFPKGYGEENDYCFRVVKAGFALAIADDCYVFHAKSKSYSHETRRQLAKDSSVILRQRYGAEIDTATESLRNSPALARARRDFSKLLETPPLSILFLMHFRGFGGGVSSIVQEANGLRELGAAVQVAIRAEDRKFYYDRFPTIPRRLFFVFEERAELTTYAGAFEVVVATLFTGVRILQDVVSRYPHVSACYYIQDYEPNFFPATDPNHAEALESYTLLANMHRFAKTQWLCDTIAARHGVAVHKIEPSLDHSIFFPNERPESQSPFVVCAMVRPHTAYRSPQLTFEVLRRIKLEYAEAVEVRLFGVTPDNPFFQKQANDFVYRVCGILDRNGVANLLRGAFLFIDASTYQAFGRTGLEAMACGCATILPAEGGTSEYAIDGINTQLAAPNDTDRILDLVRRYVDDTYFHREVVKRGLETASRYSIESACISELQFFESIRPNPVAKAPLPLSDPAPFRAPPDEDTGRPGVFSGARDDASLPISGHKFRITILSSTTNIHGGTKRLLNLAQGLHLRGHHVTFVRHFRGRELDWFKLDPPLVDIFFDGNTPLAALEKRLPDADILVTYGNNRAAQLLNGLSRRKGIKYLLFMHMGVHDRALDERNASLSNFHKLSTTTWIAEELVSLGVIASSIGFGVDVDQFYPLCLPRDSRIGTLLYKDDWKRSDDVIEAFKIIKRHLPATRFVAFGQIENPRLEVECEYHFNPDQAKLRDIYSSCAVWVTASLKEGVGMCSVEAMLCKTPLVTTDTGGSRDFCDDRNSVLVEKESPPSIAAAVIHLLTHPAYANRLAERALINIKGMAWDKCLDRLEASFLTQAVQENPTVTRNRRRELTIGVLIHGQADWLRACLASIYEETSGDFEILLMDDASSGETQSLIRETYLADPERVRYLRNEAPKGPAYCYNRIISNSRGRYICLLPSDAIVTHDWAVRLIAPLKTWAELAMISYPISYEPPAAGDLSTGNFAEVEDWRPEVSSLGKDSEAGSADDAQVLDLPCLMLNTGIIARIGFFDETIASDSHVKIEFAGRAQAAGYRCVRVTNVHVVRNGDSKDESNQTATGVDFATTIPPQPVLVVRQRVAFLYNAKFASSTRKRTFEIARTLQRYGEVATFYLPDVTPAVYRAFDIFVLQRIGGLNERIAPDILDATFTAIEQHRAEGKLFLYDIDDFVFDAQDELPRRLMQACDGVIASTPHLQKLAQAENFRTLYLKNGIDYERFLAAPPAPLDPNKFHVVCASLGAVGQTALGQIADKMKDDYPDIELHLFRDDSYSQTTPNLTLHSAVGLDELFGYMKSADVVLNFDWPDDAYRRQLQAQYGVLPEQLSDFINSKSGLKYYNAGAAAKPFVSTRQPACYEQLIQDNVNGFLADSIEDFVEVISELRKDPALRKAVGVRAFEDVLSHYTLDQTVFAYLDAFSRILPAWKAGTDEPEVALLSNRLGATF